jgi:hypothetical protein
VSEREGLQAKTFEAGVISGVEDADDAPGSTLFATDYARALATRAAATRRGSSSRISKPRRPAATSDLAASRRLTWRSATGSGLFALLEEALRQRAHWLTFLDLDPSFDALRGDPRFEAIARQVKPK